MRITDNSVNDIITTIMQMKTNYKTLAEFRRTFPLKQHRKKFGSN